MSLVLLLEREEGMAQDAKLRPEMVVAPQPELKFGDNRDAPGST